MALIIYLHDLGSYLQWGCIFWIWKKGSVVKCTPGWNHCSQLVVSTTGTLEHGNFVDTPNLRTTVWTFEQLKRFHSLNISDWAVCFWLLTGRFKTWPTNDSILLYLLANFCSRLNIVQPVISIHHLPNNQQQPCGQKFKIIQSIWITLLTQSAVTE